MMSSEPEESPSPTATGSLFVGVGGTGALRRVCLTPNLAGLGGPSSFFQRLKSGLTSRGIEVTTSVDDPDCQAILVIGGTRDLAGLLRARRRGVRIVQRLNGMNWIHRKRRTSLKYFLRAEWNNRELAIIRRSLAHAVVYQSQFSRSWWNRVHGELKTPNTVVYNGIDLSAFTPDGSHERPADCLRLLLVEGHLGGGNEDGLRNAVELANRLQDEHYLPVELMVAGDAPAALRADIEKLASAPLRWAGVVKRDQIPFVDRSAHLLFSADLNAACPNSVIEALACGLPVVAFDTGALAELVANGAGKVVPYGSNHWNLEPPDIATLARAAAEILQDSDPYRRAARQRAEAAFSLDQMVEDYVNALSGDIPSPIHS